MAPMTETRFLAGCIDNDVEAREIAVCGPELYHVYI